LRIGQEYWSKQPPLRLGTLPLIIFTHHRIAITDTVPGSVPHAILPPPQSIMSTRLPSLSIA
jgi:hypothetical protein